MYICNTKVIINSYTNFIGLTNSCSAHAKFKYNITQIRTTRSTKQFFSV